MVDDILFPLCATKRASVLCIIFKANMVWNKLKSLMENSKFVLMVSRKKGKKGIFPYSSHISLKVKIKSLSRVRLFVSPLDFSLPVSSVHWIFHVRILEWVAISFSRESSQSRDWTQVSHIVDRHFTIWATSICLNLALNCKFYKKSNYNYLTHCGTPRTSSTDQCNRCLIHTC